MPQTHPHGALTGLQTEFQQLVQAAVYHADGLWGEATFDLFAPRLPRDFGFLVAAGVDSAIDAVLEMRFTDEDVSWLQQHPVFAKMPKPFFESLRHFRFQGDIWAVQEGSVAFAQEPLIQVRAPLHQASLLETPLTQLVSLGSGVGTRTARMVLAAGTRPVVDLSVRRCTCPQAALQTARAAWIAGSHATSNASAASKLGIRAWHLVSDTLLAAYDDDLSAYEAYRQHFPDACHVHLPENNTRTGMKVLEPIASSIRTVRIDHIDLFTSGAELRECLDSTGFSHVQIMGCGALDEHQIAEHLRRQSAIDLFGLDYPIAHEHTAERLDLSYRVAELMAEPMTRHWSSPWPGTKQVLRRAGGDYICLDIEAPSAELSGGRPLLQPVVIQGQRVREPSSLEDARVRCREQLAALPESVLKLRSPEAWPLSASHSLSSLRLRGS